jgi:serine/threonine protein kinase
MELIRGGDLFDRIVEKGKYQEHQARRLMKNILSAVDYLHNKNIVHRYCLCTFIMQVALLLVAFRDLKPENILLVDQKDDCEVSVSLTVIIRFVVWKLCDFADSDY